MMTLANISDVLDVLCPLHVMINAEGQILHTGPTLAKIGGTSDFLGRDFWEVFHLRRPRSIKTTADLAANAGKKLHLSLQVDPPLALKAVLVPTTKDRFVINLSFSISVLEAVQKYALTSTDFPPTDLTIDMLYLIEAKSAAMQASDHLNKRLQGAKIAAEEQAFTDTLTGLKNRRAMDHVLARLHSWNSPYAVMNLDLDFFKAVNDTHGHAAGDHVLQEMARVLVEETRNDDVAVRLGGDEFVLLLPRTTDFRTLDRIAGRVIERLSRPILYQGKSCKVSASAGSAVFDPKAPVTVETVIEQADTALYASKRAGRGRHTHYDSSLSLDAIADEAANA